MTDLKDAVTAYLELRDSGAGSGQEHDDAIAAMAAAANYETPKLDPAEEAEKVVQLKAEAGTTRATKGK